MSHRTIALIGVLLVVGGCRNANHEREPIDSGSTGGTSGEAAAVPTCLDAAMSAGALATIRRVGALDDLEGAGSISGMVQDVGPFWNTGSYFVVSSEAGAFQVTVFDWPDQLLRIGDSIDVDWTRTGNNMYAPIVASTTIRSSTGELLIWLGQNWYGDVPPELSWHKGSVLCSVTLDICGSWSRYALEVSVGAERATLEPGQIARLGGLETRVRSSDEETDPCVSGDPILSDGQVANIALGAFRVP